ncbi:hypothetical protein WS71_22855 [Burkholderia mayonis]|uniref:Uncharacterized protein n=1 Tax=Burkholderia mayonis TaxID=1385591 RepID=A0A1B4G2D1_9BURK|nr:hypothetical protein WS71_22855 [Burkholderia mayonis]KVE51488.1 hypothetical protein WS71_12475 [Burkholderia mayonis]
MVGAATVVASGSGGQRTIKVNVYGAVASDRERLAPTDVGNVCGERALRLERRLSAAAEALVYQLSSADRFLTARLRIVGWVRERESALVPQIVADDFAERVRWEAVAE